MTKSKQLKEPKRLQRFYNFFLMKQHQDQQLSSLRAPQTTDLNSSFTSNSSASSTSRQSFSTRFFSSFSFSFPLFKLITTSLFVFMLFNSMLVENLALAQSNVANQKTFKTINNKTLKDINLAEQTTSALKNTNAKHKDDYYDYEHEYDNKALDEEEEQQDTEYTELNDHLLTKNEKNVVDVPVFNTNKIKEKSKLPNILHKLVKNETLTSKLIDKKVFTSTLSASKSSTKSNANKNDDEYSYDYGQEDYYQLAASDLKTVKDGTLSITTLSDEVDTFNVSSTTVASVQSSSKGSSSKLNDILKNIITPTISLVVTTSTSTTTSQKISSTNSIPKESKKNNVENLNLNSNQDEKNIDLAKDKINSTPISKPISIKLSTIKTTLNSKKNQEYDEDYNYYYDDEENEKNVKTTDSKVKTSNKKVKTTTTTTKSVQIVKLKSTPKVASEIKLNKQLKVDINKTSSNQETYDDEYESYDDEYYDYDEENDNYPDDTKKETKVNDKIKESLKNDNDTEYYDEYYDESYYGEDDEDDYENNENANKDKNNKVKTKIETNSKLNKTKDFYENYEEIDYVYNGTQNDATKAYKTTNLPTPATNVIDSLVTIEKLKTTIKTPVNNNLEEDGKSTDDVKGFYDTDIEWDTNETDYYDFNFTTKQGHVVTTLTPKTSNVEDSLEEVPSETTKPINITITGFNLRELIRSPALLVGILGCILVTIITILLVFFICYRIKRNKHEDNSYMINGTLKNARVHYPNPKRIYSRNLQNQHVTLLSSSSLSPVTNLSGAGSSTSSNSATTGLLNGNTLTSTRLLKYTNPSQSLKKTASNLSSDSGSSPNHDGAFNYAYIKAPTKEFYA